MTAYTTFLDGTASTQSGGASQAAGAPAFTVYEGFYDATKRSITTSDTLDLITLPAGARVIGALAEIVTADAGGGTIGFVDTANSPHTVGSGLAVSAAGVLDCATTAFFNAGSVTVRINCATATMTTLKCRVKVFALQA